MITWQYLAGFIDGEGTIGLYGRYDHPTAFGFPVLQVVQVGSRGYRLLLEVKDFLEQSGIGARITIHDRLRPSHMETAYILRVGKRDAVARALKRLLPYLHRKKVEAQDVLRAIVLWPNPHIHGKSGRAGWVTIFKTIGQV